jgi:hypothetical protein
MKEISLDTNSEILYLDALPDLKGSYYAVGRYRVKDDELGARVRVLRIGQDYPVDDFEVTENIANLDKIAERVAKKIELDLQTYRH